MNYRLAAVAAMATLVGVAICANAMPFDDLPYAKPADINGALFSTASREAGNILPDVSGSSAADNARLKFVESAPFNTAANAKWGPLMRDIVNHSPGEADEFSQYDLSTNAHEKIHGINSYICKNSVGKCNYWAGSTGLYFGAGKAVLLPNPPMKRSQVRPFVPASLHGRRYKLYLLEQEHWEEYPLHILNEWSAYYFGAAVAVEAAELGIWANGKAGQSGPVEFFVYSLAAGMALKANAPEYYAGNPQFRECLRLMGERTMKVYPLVARYPEFNWDRWDDSMYSALRNSPDAAPLRAYAREVFGPEWTASALGF